MHPTPAKSPSRRRTLRLAHLAFATTLLLVLFGATGCSDEKTSLSNRYIDYMFQDSENASFVQVTAESETEERIVLDIIVDCDRANRGNIVRTRETHHVMFERNSDSAEWEIADQIVTDSYALE